MKYKIHTLTDKPHLEDEMERLSQQAWPEFLRHGDTEHWAALFTTLPDFQFLLCDHSEVVVALGHTVPLVWDGTPQDLPETIAEIISRALDAYHNKRKVNTFSALAAIVSQDYLGQGISRLILKEMKNLAADHDCRALIAPVRPIWKSRYPLTPMKRYVQWTRADGSPFDPWIRVHWSLGAESLRVAPRTLTVTGTVAQWENWTAMKFPDSGSYIIPGALQPVTIDVEKDNGHYLDPNLWMKHPIDRG